jgi:ABC-type multidrug transport system fused ATPase/permease subunit
VFTSLALFNVLIAPLNAFPWVVNGVVEAVVSLRRIQTYLLLPQRSPAWAYTPALLPSILAAQQQQQQQQLAVAAGSSGGKEGRGCCGRRKARPAKHKHQQQQQQQQQQEQQQLDHCVWVSADVAKGAAARALPHDLDSAAAVQFCNASFAWKKVCSTVSRLD